jgi:hypothetical protein
VAQALTEPTPPERGPPRSPWPDGCPLSVLIDRAERVGDAQAERALGESGSRGATGFLGHRGAGLVGAAVSASASEQAGAHHHPCKPTRAVTTERSRARRIRHQCHCWVMPGRGVYTGRGVPPLRQIGAVPRATLIRRHGQWFLVPGLLHLLSADCPQRQTARMHEPCGIHGPGCRRCLG